MKTTIATLLLTCAAALATAVVRAPSIPSARAATDFQIVVNPANGIASVDKRFLSDVFLKKTVYWPNRRGILAVDLDADSRVRRQFSEAVLDRPVSAVRNYWQQLIFSGRGVPPPELRADADVVKFVSSHADAIGYVSSDADVRTLRVVRIR